MARLVSVSGQIKFFENLPTYLLSATWLGVGLASFTDGFVEYRGAADGNEENGTWRPGPWRARADGMYLVSIFEKEGIVEASLGGRVSADEICVLAGEISDRFEQMEKPATSLLLDYSRAKRFDPKAFQALNELKDMVLEYGVFQIVSVISDEAERTAHQTSRLQMVLEGRESFVAAGGELQLLQTQPVKISARKAA